MRLRLEPLAHINEPFFLARFDSHVNVRQSTGHQARDYVFINLVRATTDLEGNIAAEAPFGNKISNLHRPFFCLPAACQEVVILKQKNGHSAVCVQIDHFVHDRFGCAQASQ